MDFEGKDGKIFAITGKNISMLITNILPIGWFIGLTMTYVEMGSQYESIKSAILNGVSLEDDKKLQFNI